MKNHISFSQAVDGNLLAAHARHLSSNTINDYTNTFRKFLNFLESDPPFEEITTQEVEIFLANQKVS
jgi:site-specific recombinase XerD